MEDRKLQTVSNINKSQLLKKAFQFLFPLSIFSFLFSYSAKLSFFVHAFNLYFSTFSVQIFNETIDRKYMFLLCNGILVILVKNSGLIESSPLGDDFHDEFCNRNRDVLRSVSELSERKTSALEKEVVEGSIRTLENVVIGGVENGFLNTGGENEYLATGDEDEENGFSLRQGEEEEEGIEGWSIEELNKRCDDFIKRMREEIRFEVQQQLVVVY